MNATRILYHKVVSPADATRLRQAALIVLEVDTLLAPGGAERRRDEVTA